MTSKTARTNRKLTRKWHNRITRRAAERGANPNQWDIERSVLQITFYDRHGLEFKPYKTFYGTDNLHEPITVRQWIARQPSRREQSLGYWFEDCTEDILSTFYSVYYSVEGIDRFGYWTEDAIIQIPLTCKGYEQDSVTYSNHEFFEEEYADLFAYGLLVHDGSCLAVMLDKPYHNAQRLEELLETIRSLQSYPVADDQHMSDLERLWEQETIKREVSTFVRKLEMDDHYASILFGFDDEDQPLLSASWVEDHIWQLIRQHDFYFEESGAWIDLDKIAKVSPLYRLGQDVDQAVSEVILKLSPIEIMKPDLRYFLEELASDLQGIALHRHPDRLLYNV